MNELKEEIKELARTYSKKFTQEIVESKEDMLTEDNSHYLLFRVLGITPKEGQSIDMYQTTGDLLYKYAGSFLEIAATLCFKYKFPEGGKTRLNNTLGQRPKLFEIDFLNGNDALELKWKPADGQHIKKEHSRIRVIRKHGYKPIRVMFDYPQSEQAKKLQETLKALYAGAKGEYYGGDEAWEYLKKYTGIDLKEILSEIADKKAPLDGHH